jgi:hypothetical protein
MARFSQITCLTFVLLGAFSITQGQTTRPVFPAQRPAPPRTSAPQPSQTQAPAGATAAAPIVPSQPAQPVARTMETPTNPAVPPVVTFRDGLLSVQAMNSSLSSVVTAIRNKTGIEFEGAENVSERVAISMGPAPEGEVLAALFSGSKYDFVAIGRPDSPSIVQRVILTVKSQPGAATEAQAQPRPATEGDENEETPDEQVNSGGGEPQDTAVQPVQAPQQPAQTEAPPQQQAPSPEQLLQEMQQMQKQKAPAPTDDQNPAQVPRKQPPPP